MLVVALGLSDNPIVLAVAGVVSTGFGAYLLSVAVANLGRRLQDGLWNAWGGPPTTQLLRTRGTASNPAQRKIWRGAIQAVTHVQLLDKSAERTNPERADQLIGAAVGQVRHLGQDKRYPLIGRENAQYGLERNLFGARWLGRIIAIASSITFGVTIALTPSPSTTLLIGGGLSLILSVLWFIIPSSRRMKDAAFRYGEQLLQAVVRESQSQGSKEGSTS